MHASTWFLLIVALVLGFINFSLLGRNWVPLDLPLAKSSQPITAVEMPTKEQSDERKISVSHSRPLFRATDTKAQMGVHKNAALKAGSSDAGEGLELRGVIIDDGAYLAFLTYPKEVKLLRLKRGDQIHQWTVERIEPSRIVLRNGFAIKSLSLKNTLSEQLKRTNEQPARNRQPSRHSKRK